MPAFYKLGALWGGQEGSLLFWCWLLTLFSAATVFIHRNRNRNLMPYVVSMVSLVITFFLTVNNLVANPFDLVGVERAGVRLLHLSRWMAVDSIHCFSIGPW